MSLLENITKETDPAKWLAMELTKARPIPTTRKKAIAIIEKLCQQAIISATKQLQAKLDDAAGIIGRKVEERL